MVQWVTLDGRQGGLREETEDAYRNPRKSASWGCPAFLLNIEKRSLPRSMLSGDGLASKDAV
jgi:hypothetical protein